MSNTRESDTSEALVVKNIRTPQSGMPWPVSMVRRLEPVRTDALEVRKPNAFPILPFRSVDVKET